MTPALAPQWLLLGLAGLVGLCVGSFLNAVAWRLPRAQSLRGRSACPQCHARIGWYDNVPLVSFALLGGRCRVCGQAISWRYPLGEAVVGGVWIFSVWRLGPGLSAVTVALFVSALYALAVIDAEHMILPDGLTGSVVVLGGLGALRDGGPGIEQGAAGALAGAGLVAFIVWASRGGMGTGDIVLAAGLGANLGVLGFVVAFLIASILGGVVALVLMSVWHRGRKTALPFGPMLATGGAIAAFATPTVTHWLQV